MYKCNSTHTYKTNEIVETLRREKKKMYSFKYIRLLVLLRLLEHKQILFFFIA